MTEDDKQYLIIWTESDWEYDSDCHAVVPNLDHKTLKSAMGDYYTCFLKGECEIYEVKRVHILRNE